MWCCNTHDSDEIVAIQVKRLKNWEAKLSPIEKFITNYKLENELVHFIFFPSPPINDLFNSMISIDGLKSQLRVNNIYEYKPKWKFSVAYLSPTYSNIWPSS